jgi:predicted Ser/Thr protein kinase
MPATVAPSGPRGGLPEATPFLRVGGTLAELPAQFGRYRLDRLLGKGGMGAVYLAHDTQLDRQVALKVPMIAHDEGELRERFFREARAAATLHHPNLCPVYDIGEQDGVVYLTMAYIEGESLADYLRAHQPFPMREAAELVRLMATALQEVHDHGIIHRDLKPGNVLMSRRQGPVIMDFGLARRSASKDQRLTHTGAVLGTPAYMSPEQVNHDVAAMGPGCDIYSLGVILYELLTNRPPFDGPLGVLLAQVVLDNPPPPTQLRLDLDPALEAICLKALAKRPADRYPSMRAFADTLGSWLDGGLQAPRPRRPRKRTALWISLGCAGLLLTCGLPVVWLTILFSRLGEGLKAGMEGVGRRFDEIQKEQSRMQAERTKNRNEVEQAARNWKPPAADANAERLLPASVGEYQRGEQDEQAEVADLALTFPGPVRRALYTGPGGTVELFVYRTNPQEKKHILRDAVEAVNRRGLPNPMVPTSPSMIGSPEESYLGYALGGEGGGLKYGIFLWHPDAAGKQGWLLLVRGSTAHDPAAFLKEYLR